MNFLVAIFSIFFAQIALAQTSKYWTCEEGDYYLAMQISQGANSFNYDICEFSDCSGQKLARLAVWGSSAKPNSYLITGPTSAEHLVFSYGSDDNLNQVQRINDSYVIQTFTNCKLN